MPFQYNYINEQDFSQGVDNFSSENSIPPGFVEQALNVDIKEKRLQKRKGYQGYAGSVPMRVEWISYIDSSNLIQFRLNSAIDLVAVRDTPIVVYGRTSLSGGPFSSTDSAYYFPSISTDARKTLAGTSLTINDHGFLTTDFFVGLTHSDSPINYNNTQLYVDTVKINKSTYDLTLEYPNNTPDEIIFSYYLRTSASAGTSYISNFTGSSQTVTAVTHGLSNYNILYKLYKDETTHWVETVPDSFQVNSSTGQVDLTLSSSGTYKLILHSAPVANVKESTAGGNTTILISSPDPFIFTNIYYEDGANIWKQCLPDSVVYNYALNQYTITLSQVYQTYQIRTFWEAGTTQTNIITVPYAVTADGSDAHPQMTLWGIKHDIANVYGQTKVAREGWVNFLDSYRSSGESRLVCGLGGNLFTARPRTEIGNNYLLPSLYTNLRNRSNIDQNIGAVFHSPSNPSSRTRGSIESTTSGSGWANVTDITYDNSSGHVKLKLSLPGMSIDGTPISTTTDLEDWVTVQQAGYSVMNGVFKIKSIDSSTPDILYLYVENSAVTNSDYDETDVGGLAGIFTDQIELDTLNRFIPGDTLLSASFTDSHIIQVVSGTSTCIVVNGCSDEIFIPSGLRITGKRSGSVIPLRTSLDVASVDDFVAGDMISYSPVSTLSEIYNINAHADITVSITGDGTEATATMTGGDTDFLDVGMKLLLNYSGPYTGEITVLTVVDSTSFTFSHTSTVSHAGIIQGYTLAIPETLDWRDESDDSTYCTVERRWIPLESPDTGTTPNYNTYYFDSYGYTDQEFIRSSMVSDNLYMSNYADEVMKYDGTNIYRAGLPRFQCGLFVTLETGTGIVVPTAISKTISSRTGSLFTMTAGDEEYYAVGDTILHSPDSATYTITEINTSIHTIKVNKPITGASSGTIAVTDTARYRYYFRLNAVDANGNTVASAVVGQEDFRVSLDQTSAIKLKLVGFPVWDNYDYDRIEVSIYRTKNRTQAPFYRITTLPLSYAANTGYVEYTDTAEDLALTELDSVNTALLGTEIGTGWQEPLQAKYCTSLSNRLILGNLKDYPKLDIVLDGKNVAVGDLTGKIFQFERSYNSSAPTVTDNLTCQRYEFVNTSTTISSFSYADPTLTVNLTTGISGLTVGDWVYIFHGSAGVNNSLTGWHQVASIVAADPVVTFTVTHAGLSTAGTQPLKIAVATDSTDIPVFLGTDYNYHTDNGNGVKFVHTLAMFRLANAINAANRVCRTASFTPWLLGQSDGSYGTGHISVEQPKIEDSVPYFRVPSLTGVNIYVDGIKRAAAANVAASVKLYPSRVIISYPNYPEIFDSPTAVLQQNSDSVLDINSADGQQITGIIPFFGDSTLSQGQKSNMVVVFKENSIYVIDIDQKASGLPAIQKLETHGVGCQAPFSIAYSKYGVMFANYSGIYCLRRDLTIEFLGKRIERKWLESINRDQMSIMHGHHYADGKMYKLSVPGQDETEPSEVLVYHHTNEELGTTGGWTYYDNHAATGWANLNSDAYWCSVAGKVFSIRRTGLESDFRDGAEAITATITTRALDFGTSGIRKVVDSVISHYRTNIQLTGTALNYAIDLEQEFQSTGTFTVSNSVQLTGLSDIVRRSVISIKSDIGRRKGIYFQLQWVNARLDEPLELAGFTCKVAGLSDSGILQAIDTAT